VSAKKLQRVHENYIVGNNNCTGAVDRFMHQEGWSRTGRKAPPLLLEEEEEIEEEDHHLETE